MNRHLEAFLAEHLDVADVDIVLHAGSRGALGCILLFVYDATGPIGVVKYGRTSNVPIENEVAGLEAIAEVVRRSSLESTVERLVASVQLPDGKLVALKRPAAGVPALRFVGADTARAERIVHDAVTWQIELREVGRDRLMVDRASKLRLASEFDPLAPQRVWWTTFADHPGFAVGPAHGDFLLTNLLVRDGRLASVIDFENYRADGLPFADVVGLVVSTGTTFLGHTQAAIEAIFSSDTWIGRLARREVIRYGSACGVDLPDIVTALPIYSDRSIELARQWGLNVQLTFHRRLREFLVRRRDDVLAHWR